MVRQKYEGFEEGPTTTVCNNDNISLHVLPDTAGESWELKALIKPLTVRFLLCASHKIYVYPFLAGKEDIGWF